MSIPTSPIYNGYNLVRGDNDKKSRWQGSIHSGVTGSYVADLQNHLKMLGAYEYKVDGDFGGETEKAVKRFQWNSNNSKYRLYRNGLVKINSVATLQITGIVNKLTRKEIQKWINSNYSCTGDLVTIKAASLANIKLGIGFKTIGHSHIKSGDIVVSTSLIDTIKLMNKEAKSLKLSIAINQTLRIVGVAPSGAVVIPASKSQHYIGHAVDCNIIDGKNANLSSTFKAGKETKGAKAFIKKMVASGLRWGGNFSKTDTPHFDKQILSTSQDYDMKYFFNQRTIATKQAIRFVTL